VKNHEHRQSVSVELVHDRIHEHGNRKSIFVSEFDITLVPHKICPMLIESKASKVEKQSLGKHFLKKNRNNSRAMSIPTR
jgi:hypothetical protein